MKEPIFRFFFIFSVSLSIISELLLILAFIKLEQIRKYPGQFILIQTLFQLFLDFHWLSGLSNIHLSIHSYLCKVIGAIATCCVFHAWIFNVFISLEVYKKLTQRKSTRSLRLYCYWVFTVVFTLIILLCLLISDQNGISGFGTCSIEDGSPFQLIYAVMVFVTVPCCLVLIFLCMYIGKDNRKMTEFLKYHFYVVAGFIVTLAPAATIDGISYKIGNDKVAPWVMEAALILGALSGVVTFVARISQKKLFRNVYRQLSINHFGITKKVISLNPISELFETLDKHTSIISVLEAIGYAYKYPKNSRMIGEDSEWDFQSKEGPIKIIQKKSKVFQKWTKDKKTLKQYNKCRSFNLKVDLEEVEQMVEFHKDQFICLSKDKKFKVFSLSLRDYNKLIDVYESYQMRTESSDSLLAKWLGLFFIEFSGIIVYVYVIENFGKNEGFELVIDSEELLRELNENEKACLMPNLKINMNIGHAQDIYKAILADTRILAKFNYLCYSLWSIGKESGGVKKLDFKLEFKLSKERFSGINPNLYRDEFIIILRHALKESHE